MFVTNWISTTKIQKISEITNFFRHYFLSRTEVLNYTIHSTGWSLLYLLGYTLYGICHIGVVTLCKTGCGVSYHHHQRNHNLLHTLLYIKRVILHVPRSTIFSFLPLPDYERKSKKIISISQISKPTLYEMSFCMYQMTKRRRHKSKLQLAHNSWPTHAHHLLCKRISAAMQAHNSCCATGDTN